MPRASAKIQSDALLLRRTEYRESDLVLLVFSEQLGKISCLARGARRSHKRFGGSLEPMHGIGLELEDRGQAMLVVTDAKIARPRLRLTGHLGALEVAGRACSWLRKAAPERQAEPRLWQIVNQLLDTLDESPNSADGRLLAEAGLQVLSALGWALDFEQCVRCGTPCPIGKAAAVNPRRGGIVCSACGGAQLTIGGAQRARLASASRGVTGSLLVEDSRFALDLVDDALGAHADIV